MNDTPYVKSNLLGPEIIAAMTSTSAAVRSIFPQEKPVGIQILAGANCEALAVAKGTYYRIQIILIYNLKFIDSMHVFNFTILTFCGFSVSNICLAAQLQFIRAENFVFSHVADEGIMPDASAGPLLRYR